MDAKLSEFTTKTCADPGLARDLLESEYITTVSQHRAFSCENTSRNIASCVLFVIVVAF